MQKEQTDSWLQRLKDESWEAELLVSIASIFAIFKTFSLLDLGVDFFINNLQPAHYIIGYMISVFGYLAVGILGAFFIIHFSLRSYWIGLIGLNSVFPDYGLKDNKYSEICNKKITEFLPKVPATINTLNEICSVIFAASFALLIIYFYISLVSAVLLVAYSYTSPYVSSILLLLTGSLLALALMANGIAFVVARSKKYQQNIRVQTWVYHSVIWNYKFFYGPFYKYLLQIVTMFTSNYDKKPAVIKTLKIMAAFGFGLTIMQIKQSNYSYLIKSDVPQDETRMYNEHYLSHNAEKTFLMGPEIQSQIVSTHALSLFVPIFKYDAKRLTQSCNLKDVQTKNADDKLRQLSWREDTDCYAASIRLSIDGQSISSDFIKNTHTVTDQFGLFAFVSLDNIQAGAHTLTVTKSLEEGRQKTWQIPFYFSPK